MLQAVIATGGAVLAATLATGAAQAASDPLGVWTDHTGRGAVEITQCGSALCGHIVWTVDSKHKDFCGKQVIGDVRPIRAGTWDKGWIYNPDDAKKYDLELKLVGADKLQIMGYMGSKFLSQTMTWRRAPADLQLCSAKQPASVDAKAPPADRQPDVASAPIAPTPAPQAPTPAPQAEAPATEQGPVSPPIAPERADVAPKSKHRAETGPRPSRTAPDNVDIAGLTIKRERTRSGHQCNLAYQQFRVTFPCPD